MTLFPLTQLCCRHELRIGKGQLTTGSDQTLHGLVLRQMMVASLDEGDKPIEGAAL